MNTPADAAAEPLVMLQLKVARRADELASSLGGGPISLNLSCWLKAEEEVFACTVALSVSDSPDRGPEPAPPPTP